MFKKEVSLVHIADIVVKAYGFGFSGDYAIEKVSSIVYRHLNLSDDRLYSLIKRGLEAIV